MTTLDSFHDRLRYGKEAEEYAHRILTERKIPFKTSEQYWSDWWTNSLDKEFGDIIIEQPNKEAIWIDVKRNSIPITSLKEFVGDYFWLFHHYVENYSILITPKEVLALDLPLHELSSGDTGYKIKDIQDTGRFIGDLVDRQ